MFIWGLLVFLGASLITALAPSGTVLLAGRSLQGVGGALILPSTLSIVNATFRGRERATSRLTAAFGLRPGGQDEPETGLTRSSGSGGFGARKLSRDAPLPRCGARERHRPSPVRP